ncbi:MAG: hypothetical protein Q4P66_07795 [Actinomycetaceae bacterium]|nr:hypothetical protein [Actinomycetaceae bacterium]
MKKSLTTTAVLCLSLPMVLAGCSSHSDVEGLTCRDYTSARPGESSKMLTDLLDYRGFAKDPDGIMAASNTLFSECGQHPDKLLTDIADSWEVGKSYDY